MAVTVEGPLPTILEAMNKHFPPDHWLAFVGQVEWVKEEGKHLTTSFHAINKKGTVVCSCDINAARTDVWTIEEVKPKDRHLLCEASVSYLRAIVRQLKQKEPQSSAA